MKTITLRGTKEQLDNLSIAISHHSDNKMPQEVETRVYVVDTHSIVNNHHSNLSDEEFMTMAEVQGTVHTLEGFQKEYNIGKYEVHYVVRFIAVPLFL